MIEFYKFKIFFLYTKKKKLGDRHRIHLHCFTGGWEIAKDYLNHFANLCVGVTPKVIYNSSGNKMVELVKNVDIKRLLLETDAPYFVPGFDDVRK
jgi:Tat protein secretion system quality control protein TatD with DNase activity